LNNAFKEFIKYPSAEVEVDRYRNIKVLVNGEVSKPGLRVLEGAVQIKLNNFSEDKSIEPNFSSTSDKLEKLIKSESNTDEINFSKSNVNEESSQKRNYANLYFPTIVDALRESGGITEYSDISNIQVIRKNNISQGGGKIQANIDIEGILYSTDDSQNIRIYDGDIIFVNKSSTPNKFLLKKGMQSAINPITISVLVAGRVNKPGITRIFRDATLNDAIDLAGGAKIIKGPVRYVSVKNDSTVDKRKFKYSRNNKRGSYKNPYLNEGDMIIIGESGLSITSEVITSFTKPFTGLFSTYGIIKALSD